MADVRASVVRATTAALDEIACAAPEPVVSMSIRAWPTDFPGDVAVQRRVPYESRADSVMYLQVLAEVGGGRGWDVLAYEAKTVEADDGLLAGAGVPHIVENLLQAIVDHQQFALALIELVLAGIAATAQLQNLVVVLHDLPHLRRGKVLGQADAAERVLPAMARVLNGFLGRIHALLGGGSSSLPSVDIAGFASTNRLLLSTPGRTYIGNNIYEGSGRTGSFHTVLPDPDQDY